jgi:hypothetical protein
VFSDAPVPSLLLVFREVMEVGVLVVHDLPVESL